MALRNALGAALLLLTEAHRTAERARATAAADADAGAGAGAAPTAAAAASRPRPLFSWDRVPTVMHLANVNATLAAPFAPEKLAWLAASFPLVVLEHAHGQGYAYTPPAGAGSLYGPEPYDPARYGSALMELHMRATAAAIKARNASTVVLMYNQATGALPFYASSRPLAQAAHPEWRLPASSCGKLGAAASGAAAPLGADMLPNYAAYVWDHTKAGVTQAFVDGLLNATGDGSAIDGVYYDTATCYDAPGQAAATLATLQALQAAAPDKIVGFHTGCDLFGASLGTGAAMDYTFAQPNASASGKKKGGLSGADAVAWLAGNAAAGVLSLAHMGATLFDANQNYSLAVFLAGANELSYYAFSSNYKDPATPSWLDCSPQGAPTWPVFPTCVRGVAQTPPRLRPLRQLNFNPPSRSPPFLLSPRLCSPQMVCGHGVFARL